MEFTRGDSKHDRKTIYYGGNFVFKSTDQGDTWKRISPDVTSGVDRKTLAIMDRKVEDRTMLSRNDGVAAFPDDHVVERIVGSSRNSVGCDR